ncbi:MAG: hypothetical protein ACI9JY_002863 [Saprospiraceae bacterium]|jgi:hypothetical protein
MTKNIDVSQFEIATPEYDIRKDLFRFMQYCQEYTIKRSVYGNMLSKSDYKRICKLMGHPELMEDYNKDMGLEWVDFVDDQALGLRWINYDTEGEYSGYTSSQASFRDNYIEVNSDKFQQFLSLSSLEQEQFLYRYFVGQKREYNELLSNSFFGRLNSFSYTGSATGVLPTLNFKKTRRILTDTLATLESNVWYQASDLIDLLKEKHPWFLIPEAVYIEESGGWNKPKKKVKYDRYYNFHEYKNGENSHSYRRRDGTKEYILPEDLLGFEKVEGRFIERFLEDYVFTLGYVELAYSKEKYTGIMPEMGTLTAFRLSPLFTKMLQNEDIDCYVSVQPNFEINIISPVYPFAVLHQLSNFTKPIKEDKQFVLKLDKQKVLEYLVAKPDFKLTNLLKELSNTPLPQNVVMEIEEWTERTNVFTLYKNLGIYEGLKKQPLADFFTEAAISRTIRLVRQPKSLLEKLHGNGVIALGGHHGEDKFQEFPTKVKTVFPTLKIEESKKKTKETVEITREEMLVYSIGNQDFYDKFLLEILKSQLPVEVNKVKKTLLFHKKNETKMKALIAELKENFQTKIKKQ